MAGQQSDSPIESSWRHQELPRDVTKDDNHRARRPTAGSTAVADGRRRQRRKRNIPVAVDRRRQNAAEKRRTSERRRLIDPTTCERDYDEHETSFMKAMRPLQARESRPFPTWSEVLEVLISLGYRKVEAEGDLPGIKRDAPPKG